MIRKRPPRRKRRGRPGGELKNIRPVAKDAKPARHQSGGHRTVHAGIVQHGQLCQLKRNPNWWFGKSIGMPDMPYFDGIKISVIPDPSVRLANLKAGKLDSCVLIANPVPAGEKRSESSMS